MLREWMKNIPLVLIQTIVNDTRVKGNSIWRLASGELERRRMAA